MWGLMPTHLFVLAIAVVVLALIGALVARLSIPAVRSVVKADIGPKETRREPRDP
jgi:hypothetical protein